ncbi:MAG: hypothetical protein JL50_15495 [Peptococcaceae bacterium BICA1-7]|nr:MAG: hypothetical protein JL50_15495 [Peptococcaceae bacterium BICA1-7]HBV96808.1 hypothetical protein [Desulfotomaculum sp.]
MIHRQNIEKTAGEETMSSINDRDLMTYAMREALAREKHMSAKLKDFHDNSSDRNIKRLCSELATTCESRINIITSGMNNLYIRQE